ncbi:TetR/AcrR family transcriptional regulator [Streptomyces scabiei]|uniref:Transcriptional regulator BetI n=1 Tax=Streptomyces scabiei TaxID=1930 RepID=A0A100JIZ9_STRSC|nr:TetR/AcrR family transcriptional regulator [Streptomyces scabiei]GAQ60394.1 transcriptional regulator BetI [Streptomyces scabiei]
MPQGRGERADAARNRRAILLATEELLARHRPEQISMEQVAAAAGVGKGTVFHRFGSRMGLMLALMQERALTLNEAVVGGPPPLGPGAAPRARLLAFLDGIVDVVSRNKGLLAALGHAATTTHRRQNGEGEGGESPIYRFWHRHVSELIAQSRPELDADLMAHVLLGALHSTPVLNLLQQGESKRLSDALCTLATSLLDAPDGTPRPHGDNGARRD